MVENIHYSMNHPECRRKVALYDPVGESRFGLYIPRKQLVWRQRPRMVLPKTAPRSGNSLSEFLNNPGLRESPSSTAPSTPTAALVSLELWSEQFARHPACRGVVLMGRDISQRKLEDFQ